jgi:hypothetical protein
VRLVAAELRDYGSDILYDPTHGNNNGELLEMINDMKTLRMQNTPWLMQGLNQADAMDYYIGAFGNVVERALDGDAAGEPIHDPFLFTHHRCAVDALRDFKYNDIFYFWQKNAAIALRQLARAHDSRFSHLPPQIITFLIELIHRESREHDRLCEKVAYEMQRFIRHKHELLSDFRVFYKPVRLELEERQELDHTLPRLPLLYV